jgi:hypothetical protein
MLAGARVGLSQSSLTMVSVLDEHPGITVPPAVPTAPSSVRVTVSLPSYTSSWIASTRT